MLLTGIAMMGIIGFVMAFVVNIVGAFLHYVLQNKVTRFVMKGIGGLYLIYALYCLFISM